MTAKMNTQHRRKHNSNYKNKNIFLRISNLDPMKTVKRQLFVVKLKSQTSLLLDYPSKGNLNY